MRTFLGFMSAGLLALCAVSGCGPELSEEELGTVVFEIPDVPGADEPYEVPDLVPAGSSESKSGRSDAKQ